MVNPVCNPDNLNDDVLDIYDLGAVKEEMVKGLLRNCWNLPIGIERKNFENLREQDSIFHWRIVLEVLLFLNYFRDGLRTIQRKLKNLEDETTYENLWKEMSNSTIQVRNFFCSIKRSETTYNRFDRNSIYQEFRKIPSEALSYAKIRSILQILSDPLFFLGQNPITTKGPSGTYRIRDDYGVIFSRFRDFVLKGNRDDVKCEDCRIKGVPLVNTQDSIKKFIEKAIPLLEDKILELLKQNHSRRLPAIRQALTRLQPDLDILVKQADFVTVVKENFEVYERLMDVIKILLQQLSLLQKPSPNAVDIDPLDNLRNLCLLYAYFCRRRCEV